MRAHTDTNETVSINFWPFGSLCQYFENICSSDQFLLIGSAWFEPRNFYFLYLTTGMNLAEVKTLNEH